MGKCGMTGGIQADLKVVTVTLKEDQAAIWWHVFLRPHPAGTGRE